MSDEIQVLLHSFPDEEGIVQLVIKDETIFKESELVEYVVCFILEHTIEHGAVVGKGRVKSNLMQLLWNVEG